MLTMCVVAFEHVNSCLKDGAPLCYCCNSPWRPYAQTEDEDGGQKRPVSD